MGGRSRALLPLRALPYRSLLKAFYDRQNKKWPNKRCHLLGHFLHSYGCILTKRSTNPFLLLSPLLQQVRRSF